VNSTGDYSTGMDMLTFQAKNALETVMARLRLAEQQV
jgi:hypothetical protein